MRLFSVLEVARSDTEAGRNIEVAEGFSGRLAWFEFTHLFITRFLTDLSDICYSHRSYWGFTQVWCIWHSFIHLFSNKNKNRTQPPTRCHSPTRFHWGVGTEKETVRKGFECLRNFDLMQRLGFVVVFCLYLCFLVSLHCWTWDNLLDPYVRQFLMC